MSPRVSVLIPAYNSGKYIGEAIKSVCEQTYRDYEIIVVDDGSKDNTAQVVKGFTDVKYIWQENAGVSAARNSLLQFASGEFIAFLDADDMWTAEKLEVQVSYLDEHPECSIVFSQAENFIDRGVKEVSEAQRKLTGAKLDRIIPSALMRKSVVDLIGGFDVDYPYGEDTHWLYRAAVLGVDTSSCIPEVMYLRRIHSDNISLTHKSANSAQMYKIAADAIRKIRGQKNGS